MAVIALAIFGYMTLEGWSLADSLYMVVITLSTVGYGEIRPLSPTGRVVTLALIVGGMTALAYGAGAFSRIVVEGELRRVLGRRKMDRQISKLCEHFVICGYGRVGKNVCADLIAEGLEVVVVESDEHVVQQHVSDPVMFVVGDATEDEVLDSAGIRKARGLILALSNEVDNVYVTLLARESFPDLQILARGSTDRGQQRLRAAGADRVVSPERMGARELAQSVLRPTVVEFIKLATAHENIELQIDEQSIGEDSQLVGQTIAACDVRRKFGLIVVGVMTRDGEMSFNPAPEHRIEARSTLVLLGRKTDLQRFASDF